MTVSIREASWDADADALLAVRHAVFVDEQGVPADMELDEHDVGAIHLLATSDDARPVGTARLLDDGKIGRIAVLPSYRERGIGTALLRRLLQIAIRRGDKEVYLYAQCAAVPFYARHGFVAYGDVFDEAGIDHQAMRLRLPVSPG